MSNFISVHDTHRLPYNNATITAKKAQSGDTTPIKFFAGADDEELGYEVYTNARGYICDRSGELYTKSVFVKEDAIVTATLGNGASTSWLVRSESDITVNDGKLLGKIVDDRSQWEQGREYVLYGGHYHLVLHSANTPDNRPLPLEELDGVPAFNEWKEVEQVKAISSNNLNVKVEQYTKTLVLQWAGNAPTNRNPIYVVISTEVLNNTHRYAQHCLVYNQTPYRLTLKNATTGATIGNVAPNGSLNMGLFFLVNADTGEWIADDKLEDWDFGLDASNNGTSVTVSGAPVGGFYTVELNDRTPNLLLIVAKDIDFSGIQPYPREIPIKLVGSNLTQSRKIRLWFQNASANDGASLPAMFYETDVNLQVCTLYPGTFCELFVGEGAFTLNNAPMLLDNDAKAYPTSTTVNTDGTARIAVPKKCDLMTLNNTLNGGVSELHFSTQDMYTTRFNVHNASSRPLWFKLMNDVDQSVQLWAVCPANDSCNFTVHNSDGILYPLGDTETHPISVVEASGTANWNATYGAMKGLNTTMVVNFAAINKQFGSTYGDHNNESSFLYIDAPALYGVEQGVCFKVKVLGFTTTRGDNHPELYIGVRDGGNARIELESVYDGSSDNFHISPITYSYTMMRTGNAAPSTIVCTEYR